MKKCSDCNIEKNFEEYNKLKTSKDGFQYRCRECSKLYYLNNKIHLKEKFKEYYKENKETIKENSRTYSLNNKEKISKYRKTYYKKNKSNILKRQLKWQKNKTKTDPLYRTKRLLSNRIYCVFKRSDYLKPSTIKTIGCNLEFLKKHIEGKFTKGMTWENQGKWHIDHIIPLASANSKEELIKLCHYSNLQPLWALDNILKSDK